MADNNDISNTTPTSPIFLHNHSISSKLSDVNYLSWKQQILATVRGYGLEGFLTGDSVVPPKMIQVEGSSQSTLNPKFVTWHRQDQLLSAWIQSSLSESTMVLVFWPKLQSRGVEGHRD